MFKLLLLVCVAYLSAQCMARNWGDDEFGNGYDSFSSRISEDIARMTQNINAQITAGMQRTNDMVASITRSANENIAKARQNTGGSGVEINSESYSYSSKTGSSKSVRSGITSNGTSYRQETEETTIGNTLYHTDKMYYPDAGTVRVVSYSLDLSSPDAQPVYNTTLTSFENED